MKREKLSKDQEEKVKEKFHLFSKKYSEKDKEKVLENEEKIKSKAAKGPLKQFADDVILFFTMLKDIFTGKYKEVPIGTIAAIIGSLLYILTPIDVILDFIPGVGLIDDATIMTLCLSFTKYDTDKYKEFIANEE